MRSQPHAIAALLVLLNLLAVAVHADEQRLEHSVERGRRASAERYVPGELILKLKPLPARRAAGIHQETGASLQSLLAEATLTPVFVVPGAPTPTTISGALQQAASRTQAWRASLTRGPQALATSTAAALPDLANIYKVNREPSQCTQLMATGLLEYCQPNYLMTAFEIPNDPYYASADSWGQGYDDLWGLKSIRAAEAWDLTKGQGVTVAVVDTGIDATHPDFYHDANDNGRLDPGEESNIWVNRAEDTNRNGLVDGPDRCHETPSVPNGDFNCVDDDRNGFVDDIQGWDFTSCQLIVGTFCIPKARDADAGDGNGHGTHVAGSIAARSNNAIGIAGVAPLVKVMPIKGFMDGGGALIADLAEGIRYAADLGAGVINNSWGCTNPCPSNPIAEEVVRYAILRGATVVFAAGNSNTDVAQISPQNMQGDPKPIVVAATDHQDERGNFSNFGETIDVAAPGGESGPPCVAGSAPTPTDLLIPSILSLRAAGTDLYAGCGPAWADRLMLQRAYMRARGTSMAAPYVAGAVALVRARHPTWMPEDVRQALRLSADDRGESGWDRHYGAGRLNTYQALMLSGVPRVVMTRPAPFETVPATIATLAITGSASAVGLGFEQYQLFYGKGATPTDWQPLGPPRRTPVEDGLLGEWPLDGVPTDRYTIRLVVTVRDGRSFETRRVIAVERDLIRRLTQTPEDDQVPVIGGDWVIWARSIPPAGRALYGVNLLQSNIEWPLESAPGAIDFHDADSSWLVWQYRSSPNAKGDIRARSLVTDQIEHVTRTPSDNDLMPRVSEGWVTWVSVAGDGSARGEVWLHQLGTSDSRRIFQGAEVGGVDISGPRVVWSAAATENALFKIYLYDRTTDVTRELTDGGRHTPVIDGSRVAWVDTRHGEGEISLYDVATGVEQRLTTDLIDQTSPTLSGEWVAWVDRSAYDIVLYHIPSGEQRRLTADRGRSTQPHISGNRVVWEDDRHGLSGASDVYLYEIPARAGGPVLTVPGPQTVSLGHELILTVSATHPNPNAPLTFSMPAAPSGALFNPTTRTFYWTPGTFQVGVHTVFFRVQDGQQAADTKAVAITVTVTPSNFEADLAPRPTGNGSLTVADWVQAGRYAAGFDQTELQQGNAFQRADCAPRATFGDGRLTVADWVQAGRYAAGFDNAPVPAGGPTMPSPTGSQGISQLSQLGGLGIVRPPREIARHLALSTLTAAPGQLATLPVTLTAQGGEQALSFTVTVDPTLLEYRYARLGPAGKNAALQLQPSRTNNGHLGAALSWPAGAPLSRGPHTVLLVTYRIRPTAQGRTRLSFTDTVLPLELVDASAHALPLLPQAGWVQIKPRPRR